MGALSTRRTGRKSSSEACNDAAPYLKLDVFDNQTRSTDQGKLMDIAERIWRNEGKQDAAVSVILVDDIYITRLNREFFDKDGPTDVIAFRYSEPDESRFEGEIYVSVDRVCSNARDFSVTETDELNRVVAHGMLHLAGYRDETPDQKRRMTERENYYLDCLTN